MNIFTFIAPCYDTLFAGMHKRQIGELINRLPSLTGMKTLDVGGGTGKLAAQMTSAGAEAWLLDSSHSMLKRAQHLLPVGQALLGDASNMPFPDHTFDIITVVDALHHMHRQSSILTECLRTLAPGGTLWLLEFTPENRYVRGLATLERLAGEPGLFLSPRALSTMLINTGFRNIETTSLSPYEYLITAAKQML